MFLEVEERKGEEGRISLYIYESLRSSAPLLEQQATWI